MTAEADITHASLIHARAMAELHAAAFPVAQRWTAEAIGQLLALPVYFGLLHPAAGMLLGRAVQDEAELLTVAVAPPARRRGIGTALVTAALAEMRARGARTVFLEVSAENAPARRLYGALGFAEIARRRGYYPEGADAVVMKRQLIRLDEVEAG